MNEIKNYYDVFSKRQQKAGINQRHYSIIKFLKEYGLEKHNNVLEVGCGIGTQSELILKHLKKGYLTALDLSPKSIEIANKRLSRFKNKTMLAVDVNEWETDQKFDIIVLPDVLEHIPIELHSRLFQKLEPLLNIQGFILIHIPDPLYLNWVREKLPNELQVIDQSLELEHIAAIIKNAGLYITFMKSYSIWTNPIEYQVIIIKKKNLVSNFVRKVYKPTFYKKIKFKLKQIFQNGKE